ncbi:MAG: Gfo/Idh/MocA family protein [Lachnospiraceae bacterium]
MKIGIVGNGMIVEMFLNDVKSVKHAEITALCVRKQSREKGQAMVENFQIPHLYTDYEEFLSNPEIETVYIGISNLAHYSYAKLALKAGKHVICEKPFTVTSAEAEDLAVSARKKHLFLWEAFIVPYTPVYPAIRRALPEIGEVKLITCNYSKISSRYRRYLEGTVLPAFDPALAGGCLYDLNIYNLHFVTGLFGRPNCAHYYANRGYNGVDTSGVAILEYDGFHAICTAAKDSDSAPLCVIQGDQGTIRGYGSVSTLSKAVLLKGKQETLLAEGTGIVSLTGELNEFIRQFEEKDYTACYEMLDHSLLVTALVDSMLQQ